VDLGRRWDILAGWAWGKAGNMARGMGILNAHEETDDTG
jgi:hypothetical protein